jgi:hypothetical protein
MPQNVVFLDLDETLIFYFSGALDFERAVQTTERQLERTQADQDTAHIRSLQRKLDLRKKSRDGYAAAIPCGDDGSKVGVRPGALEAMQAFNEMGEVHVFTAADPNYAEDMLNVSGLRGLVGKVYSLRDDEIEDQLAWALNRRWVLLDDTKASAKLRVLGSPDPSREVRLVEVEPFTDGWLTTKPLTQYVGAVEAIFSVRQNRPPAKHHDEESPMNPYDVQDTSPHLYRVLRGLSENS